MITVEQRVSYLDIADHNGGKEIEIIVASAKAISVTPFSSDRIVNRV